ncbi:hypothetical protein Dimus_003225 [Dionaea muscipula]
MFMQNFPTFESFNPPPIGVEDSIGTLQEAMRSSSSSAPGSYTPAASTGEFDYVTKAEALMIFASEYGVVETLSSEASSRVFRNPYLLNSRKLEGLNSSSNNYSYGATSVISSCCWI